MVHILVSSYTASNPWLTDCESRAANSCDAFQIRPTGDGCCSRLLFCYLVVEYLEAAAGRDLADGGGVEAVVVVTVPGLHEYRGVGEALGVHL